MASLRPTRAMEFRVSLGKSMKCCIKTESTERVSVPCLVVHVFNLSTQNAEAGGSL